MLVYPGLPVVRELCSHDTKLSWLLLLLVLFLLLTCLALVLTGLCVSNSSLPSVCLCCCRSPWRPVRPSDCGVFLWTCTAVIAVMTADALLGGLQTFGSSEEQSSCCPACSCSPRKPSDCGVCYLVCNRTPARLLDH